MMHHSIYNSCDDNEVSEVITKIFKVNVRYQKNRTLAVTAIDDLEEQKNILNVLLLQTVKT